MVIANMSSISSGKLQSFVDAGAAVQTNTRSARDSWMSVDLGEGRSLSANYYCLRHGHSTSDYQLRNWRLMGSNDDVNWACLRTHDNDKTLTSGYGAGAWKVENDDPQFFRHFRIFQSGPNTQGSYHLMCSGIELYGTLIDVSGQ